MELSDIVIQLRQNGWPAKLAYRGYRVFVGEWWELYHLTIKWDYAAKKLIVSQSSHWLSIIYIVISAIFICGVFQYELPVSIPVILLVAVLNIVQMYQEARYAKKLNAFLGTLETQSN